MTKSLSPIWGTRNTLRVYQSEKCCADSLSVCPIPVCIRMHKNRMITFKDPVVHVRVWCITETQKDPACTCKDWEALVLWQLQPYQSKTAQIWHKGLITCLKNNIYIQKYYKQKGKMTTNNISVIILILIILIVVILILLLLLVIMKKIIWITLKLIFYFFIYGILD